MALKDIYKKASLIQIPSGYKSSTNKLYSVIPNTHTGDFVVDSSPNASRVNKYGVIEYTSEDQARLSYDPTNPTDPFLLLEPTRTNYIRQSQDFNSIEWQEKTAGSTVEGDTTDTLAPDNTYSACKMTRSSLGFGEASMHHAPNTNGTVVASFFAKKGNTNYAHLRLYNKESQKYTNGSYIIFDIENGTVSSSSNYGTGFTASNFEVTEYKNGWYRCSAKVVTPTINTIKYLVGVSSTGSNTNADFGDYAYLWGCQMEKSSGNRTTEYPSSYIKTPDPISAVSRLADVVQGFNKSNILSQTNQGGCVFLDLEIPFDTVGFHVLSFVIHTSGGAANSVRFYFRNQSVDVLVYSRNVIVGQVSVPVTKNERLKLGFKYKTNEFRLFKNGSLVASDLSGTVNFNSLLDRIAFTDVNEKRVRFEGKVYQFLYFKEELSQSELETLTTL